jgi:hypothetical protein
VVWPCGKDKLQEFLKHLNNTEHYIFSGDTAEQNVTVLRHPSEQETGWLT